MTPNRNSRYKNMDLKHEQKEISTPSRKKLSDNNITEILIHSDSSDDDDDDVVDKKTADDETSYSINNSSDGEKKIEETPKKKMPNLKEKRKSLRNFSSSSTVNSPVISTPRRSGRRSTAPKSFNEDELWNNARNQGSKDLWKDTSRGVKRQTKSNLKKHDEVDENDMDIANCVSPPKRQKPCETPQKTPSKRQMPCETPQKTPSKRESPSAATSCNLETPSTKMGNMSLTSPRTPTGRLIRSRISLSSVKKTLYPRSEKSAYRSYSDFIESDREDDCNDKSESGDDNDNSFNPEENSCSSSEYESSEHYDDDDDDYRPNNNYKKKSTIGPKTPSRTPSRKQVSMDTPMRKLQRMSITELTPSVHQRSSYVFKPTTPLQQARQKLHVSVLPKSLPCREEEFNVIYTFLQGKLSDKTGGCIYISGVPGTGKTATVNEVIRILKKEVDKEELPEFEFVDLNGMKLSEPRQAYVQIWKQLSGQSSTWEVAQSMLQSRFSSSKKTKRNMTLLLVDELDLLYTKRQDVIYNLLDWPCKQEAKLIVVTIANTMDLPERVFMGKVTSRLGLTRLTFPPYNFKQLEQIVISRLKNDDAFDADTVQLIARKVASVSGDARRALDICRRSTEIAEDNDRESVTLADVKKTLDEMIASPKIQAIKNCSVSEKYFLQAVCAEVERTGFEEVNFDNIYRHMRTIVSINGAKAPNVSQALLICARLGSYRLLLTEHSRQDIHQKVMLNVSKDDVYYATKKIEL